MRTTILLLLMLPFNLFADTGFTYTGDLNGDGLVDFIKSGPSSLFGKGGGPCVLSVSVSNNKYKKEVIHCTQLGLILEKSENKYQPSRLWLYSSFSAGDGSLSTVTLDGNFKKEFITLYGTWSGSNSLGAHILNAVKNHAKYLDMESHNNYTPPENPCGVQWGKGC